METGVVDKWLAYCVLHTTITMKMGIINITNSLYMAWLQVQVALGAPPVTTAHPYLLYARRSTTTISRHN